MKALLIRIIPAEKRVVAFQTEISTRIMQRLLNCEQIGTRELCRIPNQGVLRYARALQGNAVLKTLPRWRLGEAFPVAGEAILFGMNSVSRAAGCPVGGDFVRRNITWLEADPDQPEHSGNIADIQANLSNMLGGATLVGGDDKG